MLHQRETESLASARDREPLLTCPSDDANFINFCSGETLTNGEQVRDGSCNGIVMGKIPSAQKMISAIIRNPGPGDDLGENEDFDVDVCIFPRLTAYLTPSTS